MNKPILIFCFILFWIDLFSQNIGAGYSVQVSSPYSNYFPSKSYSFPDDYFSYVYDDGSSRDVIRTGNYYDFTKHTTQSGFIFLELANNKWINYFESGFTSIQADYAMATGFETPIGLKEFYRINLSNIFFSIGKSIEYYTSYNKKWRFNGIYLATSSALVNSDVMFSHQSFDNPSINVLCACQKNAENQLTPFNLGLSSQQRINFNIKNNFWMFLGGSISGWLHPVSGSNEIAHSYLDQFKIERGELYSKRNSPFFTIFIQTGIYWNFDTKSGSGRGLY